MLILRLSSLALKVRPGWMNIWDRVDGVSDKVGLLSGPGPEQALELLGYWNLWQRGILFITPALQNIWV